MLEVLTVHDVVAEARRRLSEAGIQSADLDARLLAEFVLGWTTAQFVVSAGDPAPSGFQAAYPVLVERRAAREPLAYIVGRREFWGLSLTILPGVLIPRPETELIVEKALALVAEHHFLEIVDACTGSGCIAVALAHERPELRIVATDISADALDIARKNARTHRVDDRVRFVQTDLLDGVDGPVDLITCNPPYVAARNRRGLQPEVRDHEPGVALFGGDDGLKMVERLIVEAPSRLKAGGYLLFEFGYGQDLEVEAFLKRSAALELLEFRRDLQDIARTAVVRRV